MNDVIENSVPSEKNDVSAIEKPRSSGVKVTGFRRFIAVDTLILLTIALCAGIAVWYFKGTSAVEEAVRSDINLVFQIVPLIIAGLLLAGLVEVLVPREFVARWLGTSSGFKGLLLATVAGAMTPGGPFSSFPIVLALHRAGADIGTMVAFITAWSVIGINRLLVWEIAFFDPEFLIIRFLSSMPLPIIAGLVARGLFTHMWERAEQAKN